MAYQSFPYMGFGRGLNLRDKPDAVDPSEAIDALNVTFTERGAIETRRGYGEIVAAATLNLGSLENTAGAKRILTTKSLRLRAYTTTGTEQADSGTLSEPSDAFSFARYGTPAGEGVYASNGTDVRYFTPDAFVNPNLSSIVVPKGETLAVQSTDNRLVSTGFLGTTDGPGGATTSPSHVWFSNPGDPTTWDALDYVQLTPGDGEKVMGAVAWRELLFVFKETKFFVFYGNSVDGTGNPVFNYRPVEGGVGLASRFGIAATPGGVYFVGADGLYVTTGSSAQRVSDAVEPIWNGNPSDYYTGGTISNLAGVTATSLDSVVYMAFPTAAGPRVLVHDTDAGWFTLYDLPATYIHAFDGAVWFGGDALCRHSASYTDDDGAEIPAKWRSGWLDFGSPDVKALRASKMWGRGEVSVAVATDFEIGTGNAVVVPFSSYADLPQWNVSSWGSSTWAAEADLTPRQRRRAERGTTFSFAIVGGAPWSLHRATHQVRQVRQPGIEDTNDPSSSS